VTLTVSSGPGDTTVPGVVGEPLAQAKRTIRAARLGIGRIVKQSSSQFAAGQVINTSPFAGQTPPVGTKVDLFVSSGPAKVAVPDVTGQTEDQAKSTLSGAGFQVTPTFQTSSTAAPNTVIGQNPTGGTPEVPGSTVTIVVAKAPTTATVPDVRGDTVAAATSKLKQAGFTVTQRPKNVTDMAQNGIVLNQSPSHGTAKKGSTVTITVGHYLASPPPTTTPSSTSTTTTPVP
jgi:serine/threonine-protein kinase